MPIQTRVLRNPTTGASNWGTGVGQAGTKWADGYANPTRNPFDPSVINPDAWQAGVSTPQAKALYKAKLQAVNQDQVLQTVNGAGKTKYTSSGQTKQPNYLAFANVFYPKLSNILQNLNQTNPRGPRGTNTNRLLAYIQAVEATRGTNG